MTRLFEKIANCIFPSNIYCICCGSLVDETRSYSICDSCIEKFSWVGLKTCEKCGRILPAHEVHSMCSDCRSIERQFDRGYTCAKYGLYERALVMDLKYRDKSYIGINLGDVLTDRMLAEFEPEVLLEKYDAVIPVPSSKDRLNQRGYNQTEVMARRFCSNTGLVLDDHILKRIACTEAMKDLNRMQRYANVKGAFSVEEGRAPDIRGRNFLVIDDLMTTGSTLDECARTLKAAGALVVDVLTFAS